MQDMTSHHLVFARAEDSVSAAGWDADSDSDLVSAEGWVVVSVEGWDSPSD